MKKTISLLLSLIVVLTALPITVFAEDLSVTKVIFDPVEAAPGEEFTVDLKLVNNPGIVSANINVAFDDALTLTAAKNGNTFPAAMSFIPPRQLSTVGEIKNSCNFAWQGIDIEEKDIADGVILSLTFKLSSEADAGDEYHITISARDKDIVDKDLELINIPKFTGSVVVPDQTPPQKKLGDLTYELTNDGIIITGYTGNRSDIVIESSYEIDGTVYNVIGIGDPVFECTENVTSVVIPQTVKKIGEYAFYNCTALTDVTILGRETVIGKKAFGYYYLNRNKDGVTDGLIIRGYKGSTAQEYALTEEGFTFVPLTEKCQHSGGEATCTKRAVCVVCGAEYGNVDKNNHSNIVTDKAVAATCTKPGLTAGSHCEDCNTVIEGQKVIEATGHKPSIVAGKQATCTETGLTESTKCSVCGVVLVEPTVIEKLSHEPVVDSAVAATCTSDGLTEGSHCKNCNKVIIAQKVVKAEGHKFGKWTVVDEVDCLNNGVKTRTCTKCGTTEEKLIPMTGFIDADNDGFCDTCGASDAEHVTEDDLAATIVQMKRTIIATLYLLKTVYSILNAMQMYNSPYAEALSQIEELQKTFAC